MKDCIKCQEILGELPEYLEGELSPELCQDIQKHMEECPRCRVVINTLTKTIELYHTTPNDIPLPSGARERLFQRLSLSDYLK